MKYLQLIALSLFIIGCSSEEESPKTPTQQTISNGAEKPEEKPEDLVEIKGKIFTEYYPGKKNVKFQGPQDEEKRRHGEWRFFSPTGEVMSTTMYKHGVRHGQTLVKHDNGQINYTGEYKDGVKIGIWKSYTKEGELIEEKDLGGN